MNSNNNRRRQHHQEVPGARSRHRKPPTAHGNGNNWQPTVPSWEKRFCYSVGSIPWNKLLEAKKFMYLYENIVQWNDSAGEEAFHNAKSRFWAEINGLPCKIALPDPDVYIDEVDWNSDIDPELLLDLERQPKELDKRNEGEEGVILGKSLLLNQSFSCTGWGETDEEFQKVPSTALGPGSGDCGQNVYKVENPWESNTALTNGALKGNGWDYCWNDAHGWESSRNGWDYCWNDAHGWESSRNGWDSNNEWSNHGNTIGGDWGTLDRNYQNRGAYKTSRFHSDDYRTHHGWSNGRGRGSINFVF